MILSAQGLCKSFRFENNGSKFYEVDLELAEASSLSIRGDSGCGKTTLLNFGSFGNRVKEDSMENFLDIDQGLDAGDAVAGQFSRVVYQAYYLIPELNVLENVLIGASLAGRNRNESKNRARYLLQNGRRKSKQILKNFQAGNVNGLPSHGH